MNIRRQRRSDYPIPRKENADIYTKYKTLAPMREATCILSDDWRLTILQYGSDRRAGTDDLRQNRNMSAGKRRFYGDEQQNFDAGSLFRRKQMVTATAKQLPISVKGEKYERIEKYR